MKMKQQMMVDATAAICLLLPGNTLHLSPFLYLKKLRKKRNKDGVVRAFCQREAEGLGTVWKLGAAKELAWTVCFVYFHAVHEVLHC